jgi:large subunit ribosomal protein L5
MVSGNYSLGLEEQLMFPEINYDKIDQIRGMDVSIITTAKNDKDGLTILKQYLLKIKVLIFKR